MAFFSAKKLVIAVTVIVAITSATFLVKKNNEKINDVKAFSIVVDGKSLGYIDEPINPLQLNHMNVEQIPVYDEVIYSDKLQILNLVKEEYLKAVMEGTTHAVKLTIGENTWIVGSEKEACEVVSRSIEVLLEDHDVDITVSLDDGEPEINYSVPDENMATEDISGIEVVEAISATKMVVSDEEILPVDVAVREITKKTQKPETYQVKSGDVPSKIAESYDMGLTHLYSMNPDLEGRENKLQIGEELIVNVAEPELSIKTIESRVYETEIEKGYVYENDNSLYIGTNKTLNIGANGMKQVQANIESVNGVEVSREIIQEKVLVEPIDAVIAIGTKPLPAKGTIGNFVSPLADYYLSSEFGPRWNRQHRGIDMATDYGSSVRASDGGIISYAGWLGSYGYLVEIDHGNGVKTRYGHNSKILVTKGQTVSQYEQIALVGSTGNSTGPHVHFEIIIDGVPVDPYPYLE